LDGIEYLRHGKTSLLLPVALLHGVGYGDNFLAVLVSNAVREIRRFLQVIQ
jgi:glycerol-3-phosphate dehydrogenase (NAD(P)+)